MSFRIWSILNLIEFNSMVDNFVSRVSWHVTHEEVDSKGVSPRLWVCCKIGFFVIKVYFCREAGHGKFQCNQKSSLQSGFHETRRNLWRLTWFQIAWVYVCTVIVFRQANPKSVPAYSIHFLIMKGSLIWRELQFVLVLCFLAWVRKLCQSNRRNGGACGFWCWCV